MATNKKIKGWKKGKTRMIEEHEKPFKKVKNVRVRRVSNGTFKVFKTLKTINGFNNTFIATLMQRKNDLLQWLDKLAVAEKLYKGTKNAHEKRQINKTIIMIKSIIRQLEREINQLIKKL